jgi:lysophospholipase L1-like esterase
MRNGVDIRMRRVGMIVLLSALLIFAWVVMGMEKSASQVEGSQPAPESWVGSWTASPQYPSGEALQGVSDRTVRMILRPHLEGDQVRVRFSNAYGDRAVVFGAASIAVGSQEAATVPATQRTLTFNGKRYVRLEAGESLLSDPVAFAVSRNQNLAVSLYVKGESGPVTWHRLAKQTSYISEEGNFTTDHRSDPFVRRTEAWYWITGLDVKTSGEVVGVVCLGDSITDGAGSTPDANARYPDVLSDRLQAQKVVAGVMNAGISGNKILRDDPVYGPRALDRFQRDVLEQPGVTHVIILEGINDIGHPPGERDPAAIISGLRQMIAQARDHGLKVYGGTLTPFGGANFYSEEGNAVRLQVNEWIRTSGEFDGVIDFDAALRDPQHPNILREEYDSGDHLHPSDAGYRRMAEEVDLTLFMPKK